MEADMSKHTFGENLYHPRTITLLAIIIAVAMFRFMPHPANVSPVAAISLFAGAYFYDKRVAFIVPFAALLLSDLVIGLHDTMLFVYAAFGLSVLIGMWLRSHKTFSHITLATLVSSLLFFAVTNFGVWFSGIHNYAMNAQGLMQTYIAGIPFLQNSVLGNLVFVALMFGGFSLLKKYNHNLQRSNLA